MQRRQIPQHVSAGKADRNAFSYMKTATEIHTYNLYISHRGTKTHIDSRSGHPTALQVARNEIQHNGNNGFPMNSAVHRNQIQYF